MHSWTCINMTPISAQPWDLSSVIDVPVFSPGFCQPWLVDLRHDLPLPICVLRVRLWVEPGPAALQMLLHSLTAEKVSLMVKISSFPGLWTAHAFVLRLLRSSSLEDLDYSFSVEISITAYLEASGEGKVFLLS